ncbi:hypothetical protein [Actinophytocola sp. NPDC049390]|uniref:hypothetical protein n=1 Tax=Actinophytocola sp. NPDC049390 TaxID=3363894 RepID=UPI0037978331
MNGLPPVAPSVPADVLDDLPPRLRKRVDAAVARAADWTVTVDDDQATAPLDDETTLTWRLTDGVLTSADALTCSCLLAPRCLHRGVAVAAASVAAPTPLDAPAEPTAGTPADTPAADITDAERTAAAALWSAGATVLRAGASGSGTVVRAELLRAVHQARVASLHRAAASGLRVATALTAARTDDPSFDRAELTDDLLDLLLLCHDLRTGTVTDVLRGTARREYRPVGSLRLYGLCTEAVVAATGHGGVVTHLVDDDGVLWTVPAIMPGGAERVPVAANGPVAVGESGLTHRALGRSGLLLSGGTASADHRLGAGQKVRAVAAKGVAWHEPPAAGLWREPLTDQVARAFAVRALPESHRPAGATLLFLDAEVRGAAGPALRVATDDAELDLTGDDDRTRENLRVLATAGGMRVRVIARLLPHLPATATALAVQGEALTLPSAMGGTVDLALDRLQRSHVPAGEARVVPRRRPPEHRVPPPLHPLRNLVHRIALAGRSVAMATSADRNTRSLTANGLTTTAAVLATLSAATHARHRDAFGRTVDDHTDEFPRAWLTAALHLREFTTATAHREWLST